MKFIIPTVTVFLVFLLGAAGASAAKPKASRIIVVYLGEPNASQPQFNGLKAGLEELHYVEKENLTLLLVQEETRPALAARLKSTLEQGGWQLIVTAGSAETTLAKETGTRLPIVFMPATDPVESGFVHSLASPRTNLTGLAYFTDGSSIGKQLETFKHALPMLRDVLVLTDGRHGSGMNNRLRGQFGGVGARLGLKLDEKAVTSVEEAVALLSGPAARSGGGVFVVCSGLFRNLARVAAAATKLRLPLFGCSAAQVAEQRVLMTYAPDLYALGYRGAWYVDRILNGVRPEGLAVETPRRFEMVINYKAAQEIGLKLAPEMLILADRVFE